MNVSSHQQINRSFCSEVNLVGWVGHMGVGVSEPKKTGAKVVLEQREKILDGGGNLIPDDRVDQEAL